VRCLRVRLVDIRADVEEVTGVDDQHLTSFRAGQVFEGRRDRIDRTNRSLSAERFADFEQEVVASCDSSEIYCRPVG
jgi:hypothetical protein